MTPETLVPLAAGILGGLWFAWEIYHAEPAPAPEPVTTPGPAAMDAVEQLRHELGELEFNAMLLAELTRPVWDRPGGAWVAHPGAGACRCGRGEGREAVNPNSTLNTEA